MASFATRSTANVVSSRSGVSNRAASRTPCAVLPAQRASTTVNRAAKLGSKASFAPVLTNRNARRAAARTLVQQVFAAAEAETVKTSNPMKIVFVSTEVAPWSKTGGLGDVVGSLPIELAKRGHKVMSVSPRYDQYKGAWDTSVTTEVIGEEVRYFHEKKKGVDRVFVDTPLYLAKVMGKTGSMLYGKKSGADFVDNQKRFAVLAHAAFEACKVLPFDYGEDVLFVANDWHSALVPVLLKAKYQAEGQFMNAKAAFCVHNIAFQGRFWYDTDMLNDLGIPESAHEAFAFEDGYSKVFSEMTPASDETEMVMDGKKYKKLNWMKAGFTYADKNLTVSPNYAEEILASESKGVELNKIIAANGGIEGIVNGMDPTEWNPMKDKFLDMPYDKDTVVEGKAAAKASLQAEVGLPVDPSVPVFGYIGRLEEQKGVDIMMEAIKGIATNAQVVVLGTGKKSFEKQIKNLENISPNAVGVAKFSSPLAHMITAGADFLLVPSRFEPCGLIQLHAMQYGTVPVVASTGGLVDTVKEGVTGFQIGAMDPDDLVQEDVDAIIATCTRACEVFGTPQYTAMSAACIAQDLSWSKPAQKWEAVLEELTGASAETSQKKNAVPTPIQQVPELVV
mmetsp:Transcript_4754/g.5525  ORF Transcript_4754/g.5525 Transcript_4754/m.5525 type:complete len:621 (+) Transcript_4754:57-1919(+)|eukprot:CAMPEP_0197845872 /NCGR_PEP_ID=MMETSP1438-20131217/2720_1 /TAXON_ID=1461541 /ORGANISM="Pterosperma sp., Strain CCMP1384" /LENGTH=620 /DNA_ID=CAMNT_0043457329 /DNA_START=69 /DNA_END=1931 /DNA_ORIENTATION=+